MAYWNKPPSISTPSLETISLMNRLSTKKGNVSSEFYEIEPAVVLDIILDKDNEYFENNKFKLIPNQWPIDVNYKLPSNGDPDFTWMGRALVRLIQTQRTIPKEDLIWAMPLENSISEFPLLNEIVGVVFYLGQYYYTRKINSFNMPNSNPDFNLELIYGGFRNGPQDIVQGNKEINFTSDEQDQPFIGPKSKLNFYGSVGYNGQLGRYFLYNQRIRNLKRREGDLFIESRFGQSIRFGTYDDIRDNDKDYNSDFQGYEDYRGKGIQNPWSNTETGGGNPMILIRNRQRPIGPAGKKIQVYDNPNVPPVICTEEEKNVGGYIMEDVNNDGSSIHITSGVTISGFRTNSYKKIWGDGNEEQIKFNGITSFKYPKLLYDQIVMKSDRIIISAHKYEMLQFAKKRMSFVTDEEYTVDSHDKMVLTTNNKIVLNSPAIYLGECDQTNEPALLGQTTVNWLFDLCEWLIIHTHWYKHTHPDSAPIGNAGDLSGGATSLQRNSAITGEVIVSATGIPIPDSHPLDQVGLAGGIIDTSHTAYGAVAPVGVNRSSITGEIIPNTSRSSSANSSNRGTNRQPVPNQTQTPVQVASLIALRDKLNLLMSRRVFVTGGGFAPGADGGTIPNGASPVKISIPAGDGVPGGWYGSNKKLSATPKSSDVQGLATNAQELATTAQSDATDTANISKQIETLVTANSNTTTKKIASEANNLVSQAAQNATQAKKYADDASAAAEQFKITKI